MEDTHRYDVKISRLEEEICRFDTVLDSIQKLIPEDMGVYDHIVQVRDAMFRLQQSMRGCEITVCLRRTRRYHNHNTHSLILEEGRLRNGSRKRTTPSSSTRRP